MAEFGPVTVTLRDGTAVELRHAQPDQADAADDFRAELYGRASQFLITQPDEFDRGSTAYVERVGKAAEDPRALHVYAWHEGRIIGDAMFHGGSKSRDKHTGWFGVGVHPDWQGRGLGRVLSTTILGWAAAHPDIERVTLRVFAGHGRAIALYRSLGFVETDRALRSFKLEDGSYTDDIGMALYVKPGVAPEGFATYAAGPDRTAAGGQ